MDLPDNARIKALVLKLREEFLPKANDLGLEEVFHHFSAQNLILVNGAHISTLGGEDARLKANDVIHIVNFTHGG